LATEAAAEIETLRTALSQEREAREKAERERDEARAEVARYWTSADVKPWVELAEGKGLGHFGRKLKGMFSRAMKAEDDARFEFERAEAAESSLAEAKRLLKPLADAKGHFDGHVRDEDTVEIALRNIRAHHVRAAARFLNER
jgi:uncharacterized protein YhaN